MPAEKTQSDAPLFSVVIPTYDRRHEVRAAIASVLRQSCGDFELLVVDDGSTDGTEAEVGRIDDPRIVYLRQTHRGRAAARNRGARRARGSWLTFLDSDDEARPHWLERFSTTLERPAVSIVCCGARVILDRPGSRRRELVRHPGPLGPVFNHQPGLFLAGTFAVQRDLFERVGGYDEELAFSENTELSLRLVDACAERGEAVATLDEALIVFRNRRPLFTAEGARDRLVAARRIVERHGSRFEGHDRAELARYLAIAGINAARLDRWSEARRHLGAAVRANPVDLRHGLRLGLACIPPLGRRWWTRKASE